MVQDKVHVFFQEEAGSQPISHAVKQFLPMINNTLGIAPAPVELMPKHSVEIISGDALFADSKMKIILVRPSIFFAPDATILKTANCLEDIKSYITSMEYGQLK